MRTRATISPFLGGVALVWTGMILGVSFVATPAKFLAPLLPLEIALDVGRSTFHVFLWVETGMALLLACAALLTASRSLPLVGGTIAAAVIVAIDGLWLLPLLDSRVDRITSGEILPPSSLHTVYIGAELLKIGLLLAVAYVAGLKRPADTAGPPHLGQASRVAP